MQMQQVQYFLALCEELNLPAQAAAAAYRNHR
jgi:hypothetical protein